MISVSVWMFSWGMEMGPLGGMEDTGYKLAGD